jgi:hypothetical protein
LIFGIGFQTCVRESIGYLFCPFYMPCTFHICSIAKQKLSKLVGALQKFVESISHCVNMTFLTIVYYNLHWLLMFCGCKHWPNTMPHLKKCTNFKFYFFIFRKGGVATLGATSTLESSFGNMQLYTSNLHCIFLMDWTLVQILLLEALNLMNMGLWSLLHVHLSKKRASWQIQRNFRIPR